MKKTGILKQFIKIYVDCPECDHECVRETSVIVGQKIEPFVAECWNCQVEFECVPNYGDSK